MTRDFKLIFLATPSCVEGKPSTTDYSLSSFLTSDTKCVIIDLFTELFWGVYYLLILHHEMIIRAIIDLIPIPEHSFCFEKVYLQFCLLEGLIEDVDFFCSNLLSSQLLMLRHPHSLPHYLYNVQGREHMNICYLSVDSVGMWYEMLKLSIPISSSQCLYISRV